MLRSIIMPLLLVAVGPLLIASFAFNFNNFTLIYLLTGGGPFEAANTSIGSTDLLITYAYRLAFEGTTPNYGFAAAVSIFIFIIVAALIPAGFRRPQPWRRSPDGHPDPRRRRSPRRGRGTTPRPRRRPPRTWGSVLRYVGIAVALVCAAVPDRLHRVGGASTPPAR